MTGDGADNARRRGARTAEGEQATYGAAIAVEQHPPVRKHG
jgi:hypothetical protein